LDTSELADELRAAALVPTDRKAAIFQVYRATRALYWRGLVTAEATFTEHGGKTWAWSLARPPPP
jgi:hypothetical protein